MKAFVYLVLLCAVMSLSCDEQTSSSGPADDGSREWCLWIGADKDTYVSCGRTVPCTEGNLNFGGSAELIVANWELANKRSYVHFLIPNVPEGTEVLEAYLELFHGGANEDGKTDDIRIPVQTAQASWDPNILTWNTAEPFQPGGNFHLNLRSQAWCNSDEIASMVQGYLDNPATHHGFILHWFAPSPRIEKGFYSLNHIYRTAQDLWRSPRLLVRIRLPEGHTFSEVSLPPLPSDNDVPFEGQEVLMLRFSPGSDWPDDWEVVAD